MAQALQYLDDNGNPVKSNKPLAHAPGKVYLNPETGEPLANSRATAPTAPPAPVPPKQLPSQEGFLSSLAAPFVGAAEGLKSAFYEGPQNPQEAAIVGANEKDPSWQSPILGRAILAAKRILVDPQVDQGRQAASEFKQANAESPWYSMHPSPKAVEHQELSLGHGLAAAIPMLGPWAAQVGQKEGEQLGTGNYTGAAGTAFGNALLALTPKAVGKIKALVPGTVRRLAGSGPGVARDLVRRAVENNEKIDTANAKTEQAHLNDTQSALHEQQGREIGYDQSVANKTQEIGQADQSEAAQLARQQNASEQKVAESNEVVKAKYQAITQKVADANRAAENALELRRQREQTYKQSTDAHYAKEAAADTRAKAEENSAWSGWRQKITGKTMDGGQITGPLQKLRLDSPEVDRTLNQLEPRGDEVPQESPYTQLRAQTSQQHFGKDYESLSPVKQDEVDDLLHSDGYSPEPIAFDPQAGQPIAIDRVQRAYSILRRYIRSGRFEGPLLGEMEQVAGVLRNAVTRASADARAAAELDAARKATITYQQAFGRELRPSTTARTTREQQLNPEAFQERLDEERLAKAHNYDPTLVDSYRRVKAARKALDSLPPEDQLRKSLRQVPPPPTINDPRPGFRLTPLPQRTPARLTSGAPAERAFQSVEQPLRPNFPDRPIPDPHQTISDADLRRANEASVQRRGSSAVGSLVRLSVIWPAFHMLSDLMRGQKVSPGGLLAIPAAGAVGTAIDGILAHPLVREFLLRPSRAQIAQIPLELRGDMPKIVATAKARGIPVSPLLAAYAAAIQRNQAGQPAQLSNPASSQGAPQ
jgi:hypothetical protein